MEQMKVYRDNSFKRYEHLPLHHRKMYWTDYLVRLVHFSLYDPEMSSEKHDRLISEIRRVTAIIKVLQNEPITRTVESKATIKPSDKAKAVGPTSPSSDKDVRTRRKLRPARRRDGESKTARSDNRK